MSLICKHSTRWCRFFELHTEDKNSYTLKGTKFPVVHQSKCIIYPTYSILRSIYYKVKYDFSVASFKYNKTRKLTLYHQHKSIPGHCTFKGRKHSNDLYENSVQNILSVTDTSLNIKYKNYNNFYYLPNVTGSAFPQTPFI